MGVTASEAGIGLDQFGRLAHILQDNADALRLLHSLRHITHIWDDLVDGDRPVRASDVNGAFWMALVDLPTNPFYARHHALLNPVIRLGILNWFAANALERDAVNPLAREVAHVCRYDIGDVALVMAEIIGGVMWAADHAAELKLLVRGEPLAEYLAGLPKQDSGSETESEATT